MPFEYVWIPTPKDMNLPVSARTARWFCGGLCMEFCKTNKSGK